MSSVHHLPSKNLYWRTYPHAPGLSMQKIVQGKRNLVDKSFIKFPNQVQYPQVQSDNKNN